MKLGKQSSRSPKPNRIQALLACELEKGQRRLADYLNAHTRHLSLKIRIMSLVIFCLLCTAYNLYIIIHSLVK